MENLKLLIQGEFSRMVKYKILQISFVVTLIWVAVLFVIGDAQAKEFIPLFIFMDASLMSVMMIGANLFYEKQENTLKTLLITPSGLGGIIFSKIIGSIILALQSALVISLASYFLFDVSFNFALLYSFIVIIAFLHSIIGFVFSIMAKDFNGLLVLVVVYMLIFAFPSIFYALGVLSENWAYGLLFSPTHASLIMIEYGVDFTHELWTLVFGSVYLVVLGAILLKFVVFPLYMKDAVRD